MPTIPNLPDAVALTGAEYMVVEQNGETRRILSSLFNTTQTALDRTATGLDRIATGLNAASTAADLADMLAVVALGNDAAAIAARASKAANGGDFANPLAVPANIGLTDHESLITLAARNLPVHPAAFGAFTDPATTRATLLAANTYASTYGRPVEYEGSYIVDGTITPLSVINGRQLHIRLVGEVKITVDPTATPFYAVFYMESATHVNHSITGDGTLTVNCNNRCGLGLFIRHTHADMGGNVLIEKRVKVLNAYGPAGQNTSAGIFIIGDWAHVVIRSPYVEEVQRTVVGGESSGVCVTGYSGIVEIYSPTVKNIRSPVGGADADGIKCFGKASALEPVRRLGSARIYDPIFINCQGRSYKDQCGDTHLYRPVVKRFASSGIVANTQSIEFDFQFGNGLVVDAWIEYYSYEGLSPLHAGGTHSVVAFQAKLNTDVMHAMIRNTTLISDVAIPRFALHTNGSDALESTTVVDGVTFIPFNGFATTMVTRAILEFNAATVAAKSHRTTFEVKNVSGPTSCRVIGYTDHVGAVLRSKLIWKTDKCSTSLAPTSSGTAFGNLSGGIITEVLYFELGDMPGYRNLFSGWNINPGKLRAGTKIVVILGPTTFKTFANDADATGTAITVPWGTTGYLYLECKGLTFWSGGVVDTVVEAKLNNGTATPSSWFTQSGGATWGQLK